MKYKEYKMPSFKEAYIKAFKCCFDFKGRSRRAEYWEFSCVCNLLFIIFYAIYTIICVIVKFLYDSPWVMFKISNGIIYDIVKFLYDSPDTIDYVFVYFYIFFYLLHLLPAISVCARRLHDTGHTAKWMFILLIPLMGPIIFIYFTLIMWCVDSEINRNKWGDSPKYYIENDVDCSTETSAESLQPAIENVLNDYTQKDDSYESDIMYCKYCGKKIKADSTFCKYCGGRL